MSQFKDAPLVSYVVMPDAVPVEQLRVGDLIAWVREWWYTQDDRCVVYNRGYVVAINDDRVVTESLGDGIVEYHNAHKFIARFTEHSLVPSKEFDDGE